MNEKDIMVGSAAGTAAAVPALPAVPSLTSTAVAEQITATAEVVNRDPADVKPALPAGAREVPLPSGKTAVLRKAIGRDLVRGAAAAGADAGVPLLMGVVGQIATVDGVRVVYEDLEEMDFYDVLALVGAVGNGPRPAPGT